MAEHIQLRSLDGFAVGAYQARPPGTPRGAVVVIQEIFGVNRVMRDITDGLAAQGYLAICPDLFWRIEPGIDITDQSEAEWKRAFELYQAFVSGSLVHVVFHQGRHDHTHDEQGHVHRR